jgi:uncharacterized protein YfaQ (DUF2300 family)
MPGYYSTGRLPDKAYCCDAGQSVDRDVALAQSCGLLVAPNGLMLAHQ